MSRFKRWIYDKFLPAWCREDLINRNQALIKDNEILRQENERMQAYINGMESGLRAQRRVVIRNEVVK